MCGIAGVLRPRTPAGDAQADAAAVRRMTAALAHRGPDGAGHWFDAEAGIGLGHRRLAIIDLSEQGAQPMVSADGRWVLAFNGEIYNFRDLRQRLDTAGPHPWRGHSDTEVLLEAIAAWGLEPTLERVDGMFALAVWDRAQQTLYLARDRFGEKPLYLAWDGRRLTFASQLRALSLADTEPRAPDPAGLRWLLRLGYIPAPWTPLAGAFKLPPGTFLRVTAGDPPPRAAAELAARCQRYWDATAFARVCRTQPPLQDPAQALHLIERRLEEAIARRMIADVPLGAFLSGGIDSSLVVALMSKLSRRPVRTFTIGFDDPALDETLPAAEVASALGSEHHAERLRIEDALALLPQLDGVYDEPLADPSQLPTILLCRVARRHVKVALSGDGGDELFFGYQRQFNALALWRVLRRTPRGIRHAAAQLCTMLGRIDTGHTRRHWRRAAFLRSDSAAALHRAMSEHWAMPHEDPTALATVADPRLDDMANMRLFDQTFYLPGALMPKSDRASMAVGLELRMPFLETSVLEMAWRIPDTLLFRQGQGKWILRQLLARHVPTAIAQRRKQGFAIPLARWLRTELRDWGTRLIHEAPDMPELGLDRRALRGLWTHHLRGRIDASDPLWTALTLLAWLRANPATRPIPCAS
ncbi:asparagine synthase (glutamine-hydrolysing) [Fontimonas thermophila]|uniref:asparagine synthase (glutamine-hydrolyzing) n=1 Tax=Fontimonas thermophila TaxID=1076937 RepID=A0A1I2K359_9GAMM|nr:asparagine synthase (glutamine-hydrolyzing) [Fontimonas thermophila]SFF60768.1 asparagine synthase (glutamine-hydrolysing) [Fontimonas thermophila]